ncbi:MAG: hypothetical protein KDC83_06240 [Flavobacteriales bacterium]|nr:hypothetical protein [Flavobacteriales bacterium]
MFWKRILYYLNPFTLFKKDKNEGPPNMSLKAMHGMNRLSVFIFIFSLCVLFYKLVLK